MLLAIIQRLSCFAQYEDGLFLAVVSYCGFLLWFLAVVMAMVVIVIVVSSSIGTFRGPIWAE
jgi:hypothetical protein